MYKMNCEDISSLRAPTAIDLDGEIPKNTKNCDLRLCMDSRKANCIYYRAFVEETEHYKVNLDLCLYAFHVGNV